MMESFEYLANELRKLGLDKKEATVYLVLLEAGPSTVQQLLPKISLSRPTIYRVLQSLEKKDLANKETLIIKGEKAGSKKISVFVADSPDHFLHLLRIRQRKAEEQEREFLRIISVLQTKHFLLSDKNEIKIYSPKTALEDFSNTTEKDICVFLGAKAVVPRKEMEKIYLKIRKRLGNINIKEINLKQSPVASLDFVQQKTFRKPPSELGSKLLIVSDKASLIGKNEAFCVEQKELVQLLRFLFEAVWSSN